MLRLLPLVSHLARAAGPGLQCCIALSNSACTLLPQASSVQDQRLASGSQCSSSQRPSPWACIPTLSQKSFGSLAQLHAPEYALGLHNLRDNPGALKKRIRVGRGDGARRGNYAGRGMKGLKARGRAHILYDGGQLGLLKFPVTRERPPYEVLYNQLSIYRVIEYIQLGLLDHTELITMKDLQDSGCVRDIKYGVLLYGKAHQDIGFPVHIQVTACDPEVKEEVERAGGSVTRVYYTAEGLRALLNPEKIVRYNLPRPRPPPGWHPKHDGKFDAVGELPFHIDSGEMCHLLCPMLPRPAAASGL